MSATRIGIAVVQHEGRFLVGVRGPDGPLPGMHEFPGGKCRDGESGRECAVRECLEETGLGVVPLRLLDQRVTEYPHGTVDLEFWLCAPLEGDAVADEHRGFVWVPGDRLPELAFPVANAAVVEKLAAG